MPLIPGLIVVRSRIHGYGVVAARAFAKGEVITAIEGVLCRAGELGDDTYALWLDDEHYFDMVDQTRWINHSCDPNGEIDGDVEPGGQAWAHIFALRDIAPGEEITYDYAFPASLAEPCACGAAACRGWIVDEDELQLMRAAQPQRLRAR